MLELILAAGLVATFTSDNVQEFRKHSNGNAVYEWAVVTPCPTGMRQSGFALAPTGAIVLKQVNRDGTVGEACVPE
jgi:hypothetical protein